MLKNVYKKKYLVYVVDAYAPKQNGEIEIFQREKILPSPPKTNVLVQNAVPLLKKKNVIV